MAAASLAGAALIGWGVFNFAEGVVDHQILGIHHVLPGHPNELLFDMLFLASGVFLAVVGGLMLRRRTAGEADVRFGAAT